MRRILAVLLLMVPLALLAQDNDDPVQVRANVKFVNDAGERIKIKDVTGRIFYGLLNTRNDANKCESEIKEIIYKYQDQETDREMALEGACRKWKIDRRAANGVIKTDALPTMVIIMVLPEIGEYVRIDLEKGKTQYKDIPKKIKQIQGIEKVGTAHQVAVNISSSDDADDGTKKFGIHVFIPAGTARSDSRMLMQVYAVDCQTEDTVGYCGSLVFEGEEYHRKQVRRMGYDYSHDRLSPYYRTKVILREDEPFRLDTVIEWKKPTDKKFEGHSFRGPFTYAFEDFHHVYNFYDGEGTCLERRPFKMLSFDAAMEQLPLTMEFYEKAESKFEKRNRNINLRFEMGTATLIADSANSVEQQKLIKELMSYGNDLAQVTIMGAASPDGSLKRNEELANQRVAVAQSLVSRHITHIRPKKEIKVYTWQDVVSTLRQQQKEVQAAAVEEIANSGADELTITKRIKELSFYSFDVLPILENQRSMRCQYMYQASHVLTPEECVAEYYKRKQDYIDHSRHFSNGDFYNLFDNITDSLELDTITNIAYHEIVGMPDYHIENVIAPYVCNRYAIMQLRRGKPDVEILRPFVDLKRYGNGKSGIDVDQWTSSRGMIKWNRHEIVANQAAAYYLQQRVDTALFLVGWLRGNGRQDKGLVQLENLINLKKLHFKARTPDEEAKYQAAKAAVLAMSDENKAILSTEIEDWNKRDQAPYWVSRMADDNPKKWYLKAVLSALSMEPDQATVTPSDDSSSAGAASDSTGAAKPQQAMAVDVSKYKDYAEYFGYLQHCFDLDSTRTFLRYYHAEALVSENLRKKYKYRLKDRQIYREMFELLQKRDAALPVSLPGADDDKKEEPEE